MFALFAATQARAQTVSLSVSPNPVNEGESLTATLTLSTAASAYAFVPLTVTASSAESGDYTVVAQDIFLQSGENSKTATLLRTNQDDDADDETFTVSLGTLPSGMTAGSPSSVQVTIRDDDIAVSLSPTEVRVDEGRRFSLELVFSRRPDETHGWIPLVSEDRCTRRGNRYHELVTGDQFHAQNRLGPEH